MTKNHQPPTGRLQHHDGTTLEVHSIFDTIQGEGPYAGRPATFLRLAHCNLQCPLCDTEYTEGARVLPYYDVVRDIAARSPRLVVVTGGEPFRQNLGPLCFALADAGKLVQIETNGKLPSLDPRLVPSRLDGGYDWDSRPAHIVVSPKTATIDPEVAAAATAFKYVVTAGDVAEDGLPIQALGHPVPQGATVARPPADWVGPVYVQPADYYDDLQNRANMAQAVASVLQGPRRILCLQMHKYAELP